MSVLIVIPCLNEDAYIESLVRQVNDAPLSISRRIVIVDGGSTDRTLPISEALAAELPDVTYLKNPKRLQSAAINLAVAEYGKNAIFLIRLDAHATYPGDYLQTLIDEVNETGAASIVVAMRTIAVSGFQRAVAAAQNSRIGNGGAAHRIIDAAGKYVDHGHHALMRTDAFKAVGGYDETFSHNEDAELDVRLGAAGYKIWLTGKTYLSYYPRATPLALFRQYEKYGRGRAATILKHKTQLKFRQIAPSAVLPFLVLALLAPFCWVAALPLMAWAAICLCYGLVLAIKAGAPTIAWAGVAAMIMHLAWSIGFWTRMLKR